MFSRAFVNRSNEKCCNLFYDSASEAMLPEGHVSVVVINRQLGWFLREPVTVLKQTSVLNLPNGVAKSGEPRQWRRGYAIFAALQ
jgi:hypothetical protein